MVGLEHVSRVIPSGGGSLLPAIYCTLRPGWGGGGGNKRWRRRNAITKRPTQFPFFSSLFFFFFFIFLSFSFLFVRASRR